MEEQYISDIPGVELFEQFNNKRITVLSNRTCKYYKVLIMLMQSFPQQTQVSWKWTFIHMINWSDDQMY